MHARSWRRQSLSHMTSSLPISRILWKRVHASRWPPRSFPPPPPVLLLPLLYLLPSLLQRNYQALITCPHSSPKLFWRASCPHSSPSSCPHSSPKLLAPFPAVTKFPVPRPALIPYPNSLACLLRGFLTNALACRHPSSLTQSPRPVLCPQSLLTFQDAGLLPDQEAILALCLVRIRLRDMAGRENAFIMAAVSIESGSSLRGAFDIGLQALV